MKFKYIEDCAAGEVTCFGLTFPKGKGVEVTDPAHIAKLEANNHFAAVKPRAKADDQNDA